MLYHMDEEKKAFILFSGGKDSLVVTLRLIENGYKVYLVTFENGCGLKAENVNHTIERLIKKYDNKKIENIGIKNISGLFREFIYPFYNYTSTYIKKEFGDISISQFNCLSCRLSMYITSIILCKQYHIGELYDGTRRSQLFAIEQIEMLKKFQELFQENDIKIEYPLKDEEEDWNIKNELLARGIVPKTLEPQCLLGVPLKSKDINESILVATINTYENYLKPKAKEMIEKYRNINLTGEWI